MNPISAQVSTEGFAIIPSFLTEEEISSLEKDTATESGERGGKRNLLDVTTVRRFASGPKMVATVADILGSDPYPVRAILFDKTPSANWKVTWHQDLTIAVTHRVEIAGFGPWSVKAGVAHVQAPVSILQRMLAVRLHFDDCGADNGPVKVLPKSHRTGRISESDFSAWRERVPERACLVSRGDALLMHPLILHASSPAIRPGHRRVLHIEYAIGSLPDGLAWHWR